MIIIWMSECSKLCLHLLLSRAFVRDRDFSVYELTYLRSRVSPPQFLIFGPYLAICPLLSSDHTCQYRSIKGYSFM